MITLIRKNLTLQENRLQLDVCLEENSDIFNCGKCFYLLLLRLIYQNPKCSNILHCTSSFYKGNTPIQYTGNTVISTCMFSNAEETSRIQPSYPPPRLGYVRCLHEVFLWVDQVSISSVSNLKWGLPLMFRYHQIVLYGSLSLFRDTLLSFFLCIISTKATHFFIFTM